MAGGRPSTLTPSVREKIFTAIRAGNYREVAARWAGVPLRTFWRWCQQGRKAKSGVYKEFWQALLEAELSAEINMVGLVMKAARDNAKHAEWWLRRKFPQRWGRDTAAIKDLDKRLRNLEKGDGKTPRTGAAPGRKVSRLAGVPEVGARQID